MREFCVLFWGGGVSNVEVKKKKKSKTTPARPAGGGVGNL